MLSVHSFVEVHKTEARSVRRMVYGSRRGDWVLRPGSLQQFSLSKGTIGRLCDPGNAILIRPDIEKVATGNLYYGMCAGHGADC